MTTTNLRDLDLTPRATAALVALRKGPRSTGSLADAIGDATSQETYGLMRLLASGIDGANTGRRLVLEHKPSSAMARWGLSHDGLGWLQSHGLDASESAKQALYAANEVRPASKAGAL